MDPSEPGTTAGPPPPPPLPPPPTPASRTAVTTIPTARRVLRACVEPLLGYGLALAASLGMTVLVVGAIALESDGGGSEGDPTEGIDIEAIGTLVGFPFQVAGMALGGPLKLGDDGFNVSLFAPPLFVTAVFAAAVYLLSRRSERTTPSASVAERVILGAAGALAVAVVATVATRLLAMRNDGTVMHAASLGLFFGALILAGTAGVLGRLAAHGPLWPRWLPADGRRAAHLVTQHVLAWVVVAVPVAAAWLALESGPEAGVYALVWGPTVAFGAFALGHLGALTAMGEHEFAWELGWVPGVVLPLLALVLTLVAAVAWHLRRRHDRALLVQPVSWIALPVAYAVAALVVCVLSTVGLSGAWYGVGGGITFHGAYWLIPVLAVWGAVVEVLSRYVAPALAGAVPERLGRRMATGPAHLTSPPAESTQWLPMTPADRKRARKALIGAGVVGGLGLVGLIAVSIVGSTVYDPEKRAEAYLDALVDGDAAEALELAPVDGDEASDALLTDEVYGAAGDRITGYEITDVEELGDTVTVTVDLEGVEEGDDVTLTLEADGRSGVFFRDWKVAEGGLASQLTVSVPEESASLEVNDVAIDAEAGQDVDLWVLPGTYTVNPYGDSEWLAPAESPTTVPPSSWGTYAEVADPAPSDALVELVDAELAAWVEGCMAATEADPADCPQEIYPYGDEQRNLTWTLDTMPTVDWDGFYGTFPAELSTTEGTASATYEYDESYGYGRPEWVTETEESSLYANVTIDLVDGEPRVSIEAW